MTPGASVRGPAERPVLERERLARIAPALADPPSAVATRMIPLRSAAGMELISKGWLPAAPSMEGTA